MAKFIIITPVLNGDRYLRGTLHSISAQTCDDWVHFVVDGGSQDETLRIVRESMVNEPRRRLIEGRDRGMYDGLMKGFEAARAEGFDDPDSICVWLNADDMLMPWALASLQTVFLRAGVDWVTALPSTWDGDGVLQLVSPYCVYVRMLIRLGFYHGNGLGWIQQESTFFTRRLLDSLSPQELEKVRSQRLAGDFVLWRAFAERTAPYAYPVAVSGFRAHGENASSTQMARYYSEVKADGGVVPPVWVGRLLRFVFRPVTMVMMQLALQRQVVYLRNRRA